jgi:hypothetical protein
MASLVVGNQVSLLKADKKNNLKDSKGRMKIQKKLQQELQTFRGYQ